jgi:hypothetical protein
MMRTSYLYAFDLIELDGEDLRPAPLEQRKGKLERLLAHSNGIRFSEHMDGDGATIFAHACKLGLEGIVSKRRDLPYRSGRMQGVGQGQEPGEPGRAAHRARGVVTTSEPVSPQGVESSAYDQVGLGGERPVRHNLAKGVLWLNVELRFRTL